VNLEANMRLSKFMIACAIGCIPAAALAFPSQKTTKKPQSATTSRKVVTYGTPSFSSSARKSTQNNQASYHQRATRSDISMVPAASNYGSNSRRSSQTYTFQDKLQGRVPNRNSVVINRPDVNIYQPTINRPITNIQNNIQINQNIINQNAANRPVTNIQVSNYPQPRPYYRQLHYHWQPTSWGGSYRPAYYNYSYSVARGGWLNVGTTNFVYSNPFYVRPTNSVAFRFDYSRPIHIPAPDYHETTEDLVRSERAIRRFDDAREVFRRGEYGRANDLIDEAILILPSDPTLHQFRALVLFARERYTDASAALYSVLAVSPGWDAATIAKLYGDPKRYLEQVAELKRFVVAHRDAVDARFLLAYHCILTGELETAQRLLESVRLVSPNDRVVQNLLVALQG